MKKLFFPAALIVVICGSLVAFQVNQGNKVTICHDETHEISVSENAIPAHVAHGDQIGGCSSIDPF